MTSETKPDTGGLREAAQAYRDRPTAANGRALDAALSQGAAHEERGLDVPTDERERNRLYPHPHIPFGACRLCALLARLATPEAAPASYTWHRPDCPFYGQPEGELADNRCTCGIPRTATPEAAPGAD